jgi:hypothetical protein
VRVGGLIAGDDYHTDWPLVVEAVDTFAAQTGFDLCATTEVETVDYAGHPSWAMVKTAPTAGAPPADLVARGKARGAQVAAKRQVDMRLGRILSSLIGPARFQKLREWNRARKKRRISRKESEL